LTDYVQSSLLQRTYRAELKHAATSVSCGWASLHLAGSEQKLHAWALKLTGLQTQPVSDLDGHNARRVDRCMTELKRLSRTCYGELSADLQMRLAEPAPNFPVSQADFSALDTLDAAEKDARAAHQSQIFAVGDLPLGTAAERALSLDELSSLEEAEKRALAAIPSNTPKSIFIRLND
jgi:hypothetical protein